MSANTKLRKALLIVFGVMALVSLIVGIRNGYYSSIDFLHDEYRSALFEHSFSDCQFPFTFWIMFLFGLFPLHISKILWIFCNLGFTAVIAWTLRKTFLKELESDIYWMLILAMIAGGSWRTNLSNGQHTLAAIAFFLLAVYFSEKDQDILAGIFLSMCIFKYQLTGPLSIYFLFKRKYKVIGTAATVLVVSLIGTSVWFGGVYNVTLKQLYESQGRKLGNAGDVDIGSVFGLGDHIIIIFGTGLLFLICLTYLVKSGLDDTLFICIALFTAWATAYQRIYNFFPLIIPLGYSWDRASKDGRRFYKAEFIVILLLTIAFFWTRTISDTAGIWIERFFFYPAFVLLLVDAGFMAAGLINGE